METKAIDFNESTPAKTVCFRVQKWDPAEPGSAPKMVEYSVPVPQGMTVLDALMYIKHHLDHNLAWRSSCRMGVCGSCGMMINGKPNLACQTQVLKLHADVIELKPLPNYPVVKDLVPDLSRLINTHSVLKPYIIRKGESPESIQGEFHQTDEELTRYFQFTFCLKCGCCMAACPTVGTLPDFPGPQPLAQVTRYVNDTRDEGFEERAQLIDHKNGIFRCHFAGACSEACPKGIDPAFAIQMLKGIMMKRSVFGAKPTPGAKVLPLRQESAKVKENITPAPERTVK